MTAGDDESGRRPHATMTAAPGRKCRPFVVCIVDDKHVVQVSSHCPIYMFTRGHQDGSVDRRQFRFVATPSDLAGNDHFDTVVWDDEQKIQELLACADAGWVDVTAFACSMDVAAARIALDKRKQWWD